MIRTACLALLATLAPFASAQDALPPLERALAAIEVATLERDLTYLASDELAGRDTPSPGLELAAQYIEARLEQLGFAHGGSEEYRWPYELSRSGIDAARTGVRVARGDQALELAFGVDYQPERKSHYYEYEVSGPLVSIGRGSKDEFAGLDVEGRWLLLYDAGRSITRATRRAEEAGAVGVVITPCVGYDGRPYDERFGQNAKVMLLGGKNPKSDRKQRPAPLPRFVLPSAARARLLAHAGLEDGELAAGSALGVELTERRGLVPPTYVVYDICGLWPGSDPELSREIIVVSAHYDHVGTDLEGVIYNGADDNGSGTTGVLGVASALAAHGPLARSVLLMWVSGEEWGLWGSEAWCKDPHLPEGSRVVANINMDMIGRNAPEQIEYTPTETHELYSRLTQLFRAAAPLEGFSEFVGKDADWNRSDQASYAKFLEVPVIGISTGEHDDYHQPSDTPDQIDFDKLARVTRVVVRILAGAQAGPLTPHPAAGEDAADEDEDEDDGER